MTSRFHNVARLASFAAAGFALLAAAELPQDAAPAAADTAIAAPAVTADTAALDRSDDTAAGDVQLDRPANLRTLVGQVVDLPATPLNAAAKCLARAVFFEARGEPLEGQLAVAQVIINRVASGKYADSVCGVINQPGQFTFARRSIDARSSDYRTAQAIAIIAQAQSWLQVAPRAMAFHATRVRPGWGDMERVSRIGNHVFYR